MCVCKCACIYRHITAHTFYTFLRCRRWIAKYDNGILQNGWPKEFESCFPQGSSKVNFPDKLRRIFTRSNPSWLQRRNQSKLLFLPFVFCACAPHVRIRFTLLTYEAYLSPARMRYAHDPHPSPVGRQARTTSTSQSWPSRQAGAHYPHEVPLSPPHYAIVDSPLKVGQAVM